VTVTVLQALDDLDAEPLPGRGGGPSDGAQTERLTHRALERRSNRLARGLVSLGVSPGDVVVVLCCDRHRHDRLVGYLGSEKAGAVPVVLPLVDRDQLRQQLLMRPPSRILACGEGVDLWRQTGVGCRVVGDAPDVTWWKLLEVRHSPAPFQVPCANIIS
jgi:non-ribosomal peptide synthetase component F